MDMMVVESQKAASRVPSVFRLFACLIYEVLTLIALSVAFSALFVWLAGDATHGWQRLMLQIFLWGAIGAYYVSCWVKSGQTLAMQAWHLKLVSLDNMLPSIKIATARYVIATASIAMVGIGFIWAIFDKDRAFLHDRIMKSKIIESRTSLAK